MIEVLDTYDWKEAFGFAGEPDACAAPEDFRGAVPDKSYNFERFNRQDVVEIAGISEGENDDLSWMIYGLLEDGRWFFIDAWCDYTGWDCQAGGTVTIADSREECERFALTDDARNRMAVVLSP